MRARIGTEECEGLKLEIVGVAGTGKSTLTRVLQRNPRYRVADSLHTRAPAHWAYVAHSVPGLLPLVARNVRMRPLLSWEELKYVIYVSEWHRFLRARREYRGAVTVLDQGPIFALARLLWSRKPITTSRSFRHWIHQMVARWSTELDAIVWLDAPDAVVLERINHRDQLHQAKGAPELEAERILTCHRGAFDDVFGMLRALGHPRIISFDTSDLSATGISTELERLLLPASGGAGETEQTAARSEVAS
jgi:broad-specificity NMP kinase